MFSAPLLFDGKLTNVIITYHSKMSNRIPPPSPGNGIDWLPYPSKKSTLFSIASLGDLSYNKD